MPNTLAAAMAEIVELHVLFEGWISGRLLREASTFARVERALAPGFTIVPPTGIREERESVIRRVEEAHAARGADFRIWITDVEILRDTPDTVVAYYVENQRTHGAATARHSVVVFARDASAPHGLSWITVHETWVGA